MKRTGRYDVGDGGKGYKLWWFGKGDGVCGVGVMVKEYMCEKVVEIGSVSERLIVFMLVLLWLICGHAP